VRASVITKNETSRLEKIQNINRCLFAALVCLAISVYASDDDYSVYGDMAGEVLVSPASGALSSSDMALNPSGPVASNPALVALPNPPELSLSYSSYYGDVFSASMLSYTGKVGKWGGIGVTAAYLLIPGIEDTRNVDLSAIDTDDLETFTASDVWARASYGYGFAVNKYVDIYAGTAVTARRRRLETLLAYGLGADLGVAAHLKKPSIYAALLWENVRYSVVRWQSSDYEEHVPQHMRLSFAYEREDPYIYGRIALFYTSPDLFFNEGINHQGEYNDREEGRMPETLTLSDGAGVLFSAARYGIEYTIMNTLTLRAGLNGIGYTLGAGLTLFNRRAGIDFCYVNHELAGTVKMSVTYRWL